MNKRPGSEKKRDRVLFTAYIQKVLEGVREEINTIVGIRIQGDEMDMLRFADDVAAPAEGEEDLTSVLEEMQSIFRSYNMKINKTKTKFLVVSTMTDINLNGHQLDYAEEFKYIGSRVTSDGRSK